MNLLPLGVASRLFSSKKTFTSSAEVSFTSNGPAFFSTQATMLSHIRPPGKKIIVVLIKGERK